MALVVRVSPSDIDKVCTRRREYELSKVNSLFVLPLSSSWETQGHRHRRGTDRGSYSSWGGFLCGVSCVWMHVCVRQSVMDLFTNPPTPSSFPEGICGLRWCKIWRWRLMSPLLLPHSLPLICNHLNQGLASSIFLGVPHWSLILIIYLAIKATKVEIL